VNKLSCCAADLNPDIILVTESWCNSDITDAFLAIQGFELKSDLRLDREGSRGGGLLVYARCGLSILKIDQEMKDLQVTKFVVNDLTLHLLYRPPSAPADSIDELVTLVNGASRNNIIIGDFNLPGIDWERGEARGKAEEFYEAVKDKAMEQLIDFPTHIKGNILDLVITNIPERIEEISEAGRLGKSDHSILLINVQYGQKAVRTRPTPDWRRANWDQMRAELRGDREWLTQIRASGTTAAWDLLRDKVTSLIGKHVPERRRRNNNRPAWMTQEILRAIRRKKRLWKKTKGSQPTDDYLAAEKTVRNLIRNAKRKFEKKLASGNGGNKRPFFAYIKQRTKSRPSIWPLEG
jgi:hypothetical protein